MKGTRHRSSHSVFPPHIFAERRGETPEEAEFCPDHEHRDGANQPADDKERGVGLVNLWCDKRADPKFSDGTKSLSTTWGQTRRLAPLPPYANAIGMCFRRLAQCQPPDRLISKPTTSKQPRFD